MSSPRRRVGLFVVAGVVVTLLLAGVISSFASSEPDGLERVAIDEGFADTADEHAFAKGPMADYSTRGVGDERLSTGVAGVVGVGVTFVIAAGCVALIRRARRRAPAPVS
jgi:hypothetical protein